MSAQSNIHKRPNRRTLRSRVRRTIYLTSFINILLFTVLILGALSFSLKPVSGFASSLISRTIADELNSSMFLAQHGIADLRQFDPQGEKGTEWVNKLDHMAKLETYLPKNVQAKTAEAFVEAQDAAATFSFNPGFEFVSIHVEAGGKLLYSNVMRQMKIEEMGPLHAITRYFIVRTKSDLTDASGTVIGEVEAFITPEIVLAMYLSIAFMLLILVLVALTMTKFISMLISRPVLQPLDQAIARMNELSQESAAWDKPLTIPKAVREIEQLADATNLIMSKMQLYSNQLQQQKAALEEQKQVLEEQNEELEAQNEELTLSKSRLQEAQDKLLRSDRSIRSLLDNAGQGFLTFGPELRIGEEYSRECRVLFGRDIAGVPFPALLALGDDEQRKFLDSLLQKLFQERDAGRRAMYLPLLVDELQVNGLTIKLDYKFIETAPGAEAIMVILTDITEKRELESQVEIERNILKMVVKVIVGYGDFTECVRDFKLFAESELPETLLSEQSVKSKLLSVYRDIHTYKGNFSQFGLPHITRKLHEAETQLSAWLKQADELSADELLARVGGLHIETWLNDDLAVLQSVIGDTFFNQDDLLMIDKMRIIEIEKKMLALLSPNECKLLLPELRKLRYKPFKELLKGYPDYVAGLAERMEKLVLPIAVEGEEFAADTEKYYDFSRSLVNVFRNILDHAVEPPEERTALGKEEMASIACRVQLEQRHIVVEISDDGRGIDPEAVRAKAVQRGLLTAGEAASLRDEDAVGLIFRDEFSTKDEVSDISGRGIGLASVKAEAEKLGGTVDVITAPGRGTTFRFTLPYEELDAAPQVEYPDLLLPSIGTVQHYFARFMGVSLTADETFLPHPGDKLALRKVTAFITLKGAVEGMFIMSVDETLSRAIVRGTVLDPISEQELGELLEDSLAETANTVLGNSFSMFQQYADFILMEPPITMQTEGASIKYADADIWTCAFHSEHGAMQISFALTKRG
ncbi:ATP-binding protein [Paenibacillus chartarius]|uniref:histidine kinase n=1 Tax=Paenibacillus chartarius TaxID=747481 RepID=A0ABV6DPT7_9BACL